MPYPDSHGTGNRCQHGYYRNPLGTAGAFLSPQCNFMVLGCRSASINHRSGLQGFVNVTH